MRPLNFPQYKFRVKKDNETLKIWDRIRKKFIVLTPEEWVRQHTIEFLIREKKYPPALIQVEKQFSKAIQSRIDIVVFDRSLNPYLLIECKQPKTTNHIDAFEQIAKYNSQLNALYIMVTNGLVHYFARVSDDHVLFRETIPNYGVLD